MKITLDVPDETYHELLKNTGAKTFQQATIIALTDYVRHAKMKARLRKLEAKKARTIR
jgi:hypothetical protein